MKTKIAQNYLIQEDSGVLLRTGGPGSIIVTADEEPEPVELDTRKQVGQRVGKRQLKPIEQLQVRGTDGVIDTEATEAAIQSHYADHYAVLEGLAVPWEVGLKCERGQAEPVSYGGKLYNVNITHTVVDPNHTPDIVENLYTEIPAPAGSGYPVWYRPAGAHDAWHLNDRVEWPEGGQVWQCTGTDAGGNNVWEPGVYGWTKIEDL